MVKNRSRLSSSLADTCLAYRTAQSASVNSPYGLATRHLYHELNPHPSLGPPPSHNVSSNSPSQAQNEEAYRQLLVQGSLAILLPTEDLQNGPLRVLVGDIVADLILGQALAGKVCEGWFIHDAINRFATVLNDKVRPKATGDELREDAKNRLEKFGLLASESDSQHHHSSSKNQSKISAWTWRIMQYGYLLYLFLRYVLKELQCVRQHPRRRQLARILPSTPTLSKAGESSTPSLDDQQPRSVLAFGVYALISTLLKLADRMPWLVSIFVFMQHLLLAGVGRLAEFDSTLDRYVVISQFACFSRPLRFCSAIGQVMIP